MLGATFLAYASTLAFGWIYDDIAQVPGNAMLQWSRIADLFTRDLWAGTAAGTGARFYRPLLSLWFLLNKSLFGLNPHWFHATTVLAHVAATALAFAVARKLLRNSAAALLATTIFGLHPLHTETAAWTSDVDDSLAAILMCASFLAYLKTCKLSARSWRWWIASGFCFALALLMKEAAIVFPALVLIHLLATSKDRAGLTKRSLLLASCYGAIALTYVVIRNHVLGGWMQSPTSATWSASLLTAPYVAVFYAAKLIAPFRLAIHYDPPLVTSAPTLRFIIPLLLLVGAAVAIWRARRNRELLIALAWVAVPLVPALNIRWLNDGDPLHDRYAYVSVFGIALLAGLIW